MNKLSFFKPILPSLINELISKCTIIILDKDEELIINNDEYIYIVKNGSLSTTDCSVILKKDEAFGGLILEKAFVVHEQKYHCINGGKLISDEFHTELICIEFEVYNKIAQKSMTQSESLLSFISSVQFFKQWSRLRCQRLLHDMKVVKFKSNSIVYREYTPCDKVYFIIKGDVQISKHEYEVEWPTHPRTNSQRLQLNDTIRVRLQEDTAQCFPLRFTKQGHHCLIRLRLRWNARRISEDDNDPQTNGPVRIKACPGNEPPTFESPSWIWTSTCNNEVIIPNTHPSFEYGNFCVLLHSIQNVEVDIIVKSIPSTEWRLTALKRRSEYEFKVATLHSKDIFGYSNISGVRDFTVTALNRLELLEISKPVLLFHLNPTHFEDYILKRSIRWFQYAKQQLNTRLLLQKSLHNSNSSNKKSKSKRSSIRKTSNDTIDNNLFGLSYHAKEQIGEIIDANECVTSNEINMNMVKIPHSIEVYEKSSMHQNEDIINNSVFITNSENLMEINMKIVSEEDDDDYDNNTDMNIENKSHKVPTKSKKHHRRLKKKKKKKANELVIKGTANHLPDKSENKARLSKKKLGSYVKLAKNIIAVYESSSATNTNKMNYNNNRNNSNNDFQPTSDKYIAMLKYINN